MGTTVKRQNTALALKLAVIIPLTCGIWSAVVPCRALAQDTNSPLNILFISSFTRNIPAQEKLETGIKKTLEHRKGTHNVFYEFMDFLSPQETEVETAFADFLQEKYRGVRFEYLVGWAARAIRFIGDHDGFFPDAKRIYLEQTDESGLVVSEKKIIIGVRANFRASLAEALRIEQPKRMIVIGTTKDVSARTRLRRFKAQLSELDPGIEAEYLLDRTLAQVASRLSNEPRKGTMAFYLLMFSDGEGRHMSPYDVVRQIASRSAVPIYSHWESLMGSGIVGGYLMSIEVVGANLINTIFALQNGQTIPRLSPMRHVYDWNAVAKWQINEDRIPDDAVVINPPDDLFSRYRWHIIVVLSLCFIEFFLIFFLVLNRKKRLKFERELINHRNHLEERIKKRTAAIARVNEELKDSENRFRSLSDAAFEGILISERGKILDTNTALADMFGYRKDELIGTNAFDLAAPPERESIRNKILSYDTELYQADGIRKDGTVFPIEVQAKMFVYQGKNVRVAAVRDNSGPKKAEALLRESERLQGVLEMAGAVSHEMSQPLMAIDGYAELISMAIPQDDPLVEKVKKMSLQIDRIRKITREIMNITRYETKAYTQGKIIDISKSSKEEPDSE